VPLCTARLPVFLIILLKVYAVAAFSYADECIENAITFDINLVPVVDELTLT